MVTDPKDQVIDYFFDQEDLTPPLQNGYSEEDNYRFYRDQYEGFTIVVGRNLRSFDDMRKNLLYLLIAVGGAMIALSFLLSSTFAGKAVRPLKFLNQKILSIDPQNLTPPSLAADYPDDEIGQLAKTFDGFIHKLSQAFRREKQFTQDASHELRTPLMTLKSSLELIAIDQSHLTSAQSEKIALMETAVKKIEYLLEELLFISRGSAKRDKEKIVLAKFIKEISPEFSLMAREKNLGFSIKVKKGFSVHTSPLLLHKVIGNLLRNAIKYTKKGKVEVIVDGAQVRVCDTGIGIAPEDLPLIFDRFYRADHSRSAVQGFGLGLAICKDICDQEGWKISATSELGRGSCFTVSFNPAS